MEPGDRLIKKPVYPGGRKAMALFLKENLTYPIDALENKIEGMVMVRVDIDGNGNVIRTRLKKKLGYGCDEEAVRLVKLLKFFVANRRKVRVTHHKKIKIHFTLPKSEVKASTPKTKGSSTDTTQGYEIVYNYIPKKK